MRTCRDKGSSGPSVFIADDSADTFGYLKNIVAGDDFIRFAGGARTLSGFLEEATMSGADVFLVSSAFLGLLSPEDNRRIVTGNPGSVILAVTDTKDYVELKAALRRGARDMVACDTSPDEIKNLIDTYYREAVTRNDLASRQAVFEDTEESAYMKLPADGSPAHVALITSGTGGAGKSFIAAQLAGICARHGEAKTCLVDLDFKFGGLSLVLDTGAVKRSQIDLIEVADELETAHVESILVKHAGGFSFAPGFIKASLDRRDIANEAPVNKMISILKDLFDVVICDVPPDMCKAPLISEANSIYILAAPCLSSATCAGALGRHMDGSRLIVNMCDRRGAAPAAKMAEIAGLALEAAVPEDSGAGRMFDSAGEILAGRVNLSVIRSLIPVAHRCRHFEELNPDKRFSWFTGRD